MGGGTSRQEPTDGPLTGLSPRGRGNLEWVRLRERHPEAFEEAKSYEKTALENGSPFTWSQGEPLASLEQPERVEQIRAEHAKRLKRMKGKQVANPLRPDREPVDIDDLYGQAKVCLACHK